MNYYLSQIILASGREDTEKWVNILFVVVLAAFWLIGGIVKAKSQQAKRQKNKQSPGDATPRPPAANRGPGELILEKLLGSSISLSRNQQHPVSQQSIKKSPDTVPAKYRLSAKSRSDKFASKQKMNQRRNQKLLIQQQSLEQNLPKTAQIDNNIQELTEFTTDSVKKFEITHPKVPSEVPISRYLLDFTDADSLKKAILYYEVLGKPISLRDSSNPFI